MQPSASPLICAPSGSLPTRALLVAASMAGARRASETSTWDTRHLGWLKSLCPCLLWPSQSSHARPSRHLSAKIPRLPFILRAYGGPPLLPASSRVALLSSCSKARQVTKTVFGAGIFADGIVCAWWLMKPSLGVEEGRTATTSRLCIRRRAPPTTVDCPYGGPPRLAEAPAGR